MPDMTTSNEILQELPDTLASKGPKFQVGGIIGVRRDWLERDHA